MYLLSALPPSAFVNRPPWNGLEYDLASNEEDEKKSQICAWT